MKTTTTTASRPTLASLEQRVAKQERAITTGVRAGTIDASEAKAMRAELGKARRHFENDAFDGNGLSRREQASKALHGVAREIKGARGDENVDLGKRTADIDRRITQGVTDGSLTAAEGEALKATSSSVKAELAAATTPEAKQAAAAKVLELSKQVATDRHDPVSPPVLVNRSVRMSR